MKCIKKIVTSLIIMSLISVFSICTLAEGTEYVLKGKIKKQPINGYSFWYSVETDRGDSFPLDSLKQCDIDPLSLKIMPPKSARPDEGSAKWFGIGTLNNGDIVQLNPDGGYSAAIKWECPENGTYHVYLDVWLGSWSIPKESELGDGICDGTYISAYQNTNKLFSVNTPGTSMEENAKQADDTLDPPVLPDVDKDMNMSKGDVLWLIVDPKTAGGWDQVACNFNIQKQDAATSSSQNSATSSNTSTVASSDNNVSSKTNSTSSVSSESNSVPVNGRVLDASGSVMKKAKIEIGSLAAVTGDNGDFSLSDIPLGECQITVYDEQGNKKAASPYKIAAAVDSNSKVDNDTVYVDENGINVVVNVKDDGTIELKQDTSDSSNISSESSKKNDLKSNSTASTKSKLNVGRLVLLIVIIVVVLAGAAVAVYFLVIKKKMSNKSLDNNTEESNEVKKDIDKEK